MSIGGIDKDGSPTIVYLNNSYGSSSLKINGSRDDCSYNVVIGPYSGDLRPTVTVSYSIATEGNVEPTYKSESIKLNDSFEALIAISYPKSGSGPETITYYPYVQYDSNKYDLEEVANSHRNTTYSIQYGPTITYTYARYKVIKK